MLPEPGPLNAFLSGHAALLLDSHRRLTGRPLLPASTTDAGAALYHAPCAVLSHDAGADPIFTYANLAAQRRFALPWQRLVGMPSRYSAEAPDREERQRLLDCVARQGWIGDYRGVRIAADGRRFEIVGATVWNLVDGDGRICGQAASFSDWNELA